MKKKGLIIAVIAVLFSILITLTGCDGKTEETSSKNANNVKQEQKNPGKEQEKDKFKEGVYDFVPEEEGEEVLKDSVSVEFRNGKITLSDGFAGLVQEGTYKVDGAKIVGTYNSMTYIDHSNGGEYTTKDIKDEFEFYILEDESIRDFVGYGVSLDNVMLKDALYKLRTDN